MAANIDKYSITAKATADPLVFTIGFDFTDDPAFSAASGWLSTWLHAEFTYNTNMSGAEFTSAAAAAMAAARKPAAETTLETTLRNLYGVITTRVNPAITAVPMEVKIVAVDDTVIVKTQQVT